MEKQKYTNRIDELRKARGWTWQQLNDMVFGSKKIYSHMWKISRGDRFPRPESVVRFEVAFGKPWNEIWDRWYAEERATVEDLLR